MNGTQSDESAGAARSRPPGNEIESVVEWYRVRDRTNSPDLVAYCGIVPRGRLRASPTVLTGSGAHSPGLVSYCGLVTRGGAAQSSIPENPE